MNLYKSRRRLAALQQVIGVVLVFLFAVFTSGCATLPQNTNIKMSQIESSSSPLSTDKENLSSSLKPMLAEHPNQSGFYALPNGVDAMAARLKLIEAAQSTLDAQYYIWHDDLVGRGMFQQLLQAADRGVKVRVLLDDLDTAGKDDLLLKINAHPNLEIRLFNPFPNRSARWLDFLTSTRRVNHRMHNKSITADRAATILGGRNIGNEYLGAISEVGFSDMDVLGVGPVAEEVGNSFELYWNSNWAYPLRQIVKGEEPNAEAVAAFRQELDNYIAAASEGLYVQALQNAGEEKFDSMRADDFSWGRWILVYDQPSKVVAKKVDADTHLAPRLKEGIDAAKEDLIIVSPYFVPGSDFTDYLVGKVNDGVRVRIMTNSLSANDVALVHAGYRRYREELIRGGVELYEFKPFPSALKDNQTKQKRHWIGSSKASLHGKYLGFDRQHVFIGSFNLDGRSVSLNTELGVYFESEPYAKYLSDTFDELAIKFGYRVTLNDGDLQWQTLRDGEELIYNSEPETNWWQRSVNRFLSWFVPEGQL